MILLLEKYDEVYRKYKDISDKIADAKREISKISDVSSNEIPARIENLKNQLEKIDEYVLKVESFKKLAEESLTSKNVLTVEAPPGYRVNLNRLRSWAMKIDPRAKDDPNAKDDPYAQRVYLVACCDLRFLGQKKAEFLQRIAELEKDQSVGATEAIKELEAKIEALNSELREYAQGDDVKEFVRMVQGENEDHICLEAPTKYTVRREEPDFWVPGSYGMPIPAEGEHSKKLKNYLGDYFDEVSGEVFFPYGKIRTNTEFAMTVSCIPARRRLSEMDAGIRNFAYNFIDKAPVGTRKVYIIDAVRQNTMLAGSLKELENSCVMHSIPRNQEQINTTLEELVSSFNEIDDTLEHYDTVAQYNKSVTNDKKIPRTLVVLVGWPNAFDKAAVGHIKRIVTNYERYGISFIAVRIAAKESTKEDFNLSEYVGENVIHVEMTAKENLISYGNEESQLFNWYTFKHGLSEDYCAAVKANNVRKDELGNEYTERCNIKGSPDYTRKYKKLELPFGIGAKDSVQKISFENENFATYLVGASRSGKSTLLHVLIAGLIRNYHPDNVELWLADFKQLEFKNYIEHLPPHVKYVLLDESPELVYDLLDKLTAKMLERQHLFGKLNVKRIDQIDPATLDEPMPVIFVILDEFSIMSQAVSESQAYKLKLQNILAKGAALGIRFLFASQTFTKGIAGLTGTAKDQVQQRISMKASREEIDATLELTANLKTDQVKLWMEALPPHYALIKQRPKEDAAPEVKRVHVMYFKDYDVRDRMIDEINAQMKASDTYQPDNIYSYVDKHPVLVDGNSYEAFDEKRVREYITVIAKDESRYNGDETFVSFGTPRLMENMKAIAIAPESRQNILFVADSAEAHCQMSVLMSVVKSFEMQGKEVEVWAYDRNRIYRAFRDTLWADYEVLLSAEDVARRIKELKEVVQSKDDSEEKMIVLIGFENILPELEFVDGEIQIEVEEATKVTDAVNKETEEETEAKADEETDVEVQEPDADALRQKMLAEMMAKRLGSISVETPEEEDEEEDLAALKAQISGQFAQVKETEKSITANNASTTAYRSVAKGNLLADLQYVIQQGGRKGIHFAVVLNSYGDLKQTGLRLDYFRHRVAMSMPAEDSRTMFGTKVASELPEHIGVYTDMMDRYSFRPYLHRGLTWDGLEVSENGEVINILD